MDYGKYKYQMSKKAHEAKKKQTVILVKEVKFRTRTDEHDFQFKLRNIKKFLAQGNKVKAAVFFRGREITHPDIGRNILNRIVEATKEEAVVEMATKFEGRNMILILGPVAAPVVQAPKKVKNKDVEKEDKKEKVKEEVTEQINEEQEGTKKDA
jgi:translation initiation factor IF-3